MPTDHIAPVLVESLNTHKVTHAELAEMMRRLADATASTSSSDTWTVEQMTELLNKVDVAIKGSSLGSRDSTAATLLFTDIGVRLTAAAKAHYGAESASTVRAAMKHVRDVSELSF